MPVMSTRGSISVRFVNHLVPKPPATINYQLVSVLRGNVAYTTPGTYSWICPSNVTSVSVVCVGGGGSGSTGSGTYAFYGYQGGGGGGGGGGLGYKNSISVTPGNSYTVVVGSGGASVGVGSIVGNNGGDSYFIDTSTVKGSGGSGAPGGATTTAPGGTYVGDGGGNGGFGGNCNANLGSGGGGGAGGYSGIGGNGASAGGSLSSATNGTGGSGAGGGGNPGVGGGGGGGVGILGEGPSGTTGTISPSTASGGGGGSSGNAGGTRISGAFSPGGAGGQHGGGGGGGMYFNSGSPLSGAGGPGAVQIAYNTTFPTLNLTTEYTTRSVTTSSGTYTVAVNEQLYDTPGAYYWICPAGVTSVCVFCIGGGGSSGPIRSGGGGAYAYINNYPTTPGQGYLVVVGAGGYYGYGTSVSVDESVSYGSAPRASGTGYGGNAFNTTNYQGFYSGDDYNNARTGGDASWFNSFTTVLAGGGENGIGGYNPSSPGSFVNGGMGGVGYYNPAYPGGGQRGGGGWVSVSNYQVGSMSPYASPSVRFGGGGGAGGGGPFGDNGFGPAEPGSAGNGFDSRYLTGDASHTEAGNYYASGGGGMGVYGISNTGADGSEIFSNSKATYGSAGGGGSGGQPGIGGKLQISGGGPGGKYGGGAGAGYYDNSLGLGALGQGASGAVRIIWGAGRSFANTNTASTTTSVTIPLPSPRTYRVVTQTALFDTPGAYTWICPAGVTSISVMCVGGGGAGFNVGGGGGGYAYIYDYPTTPGQGYLVVVGAGGKSSYYTGGSLTGIDPTVSYGSALRLSGSGNGQVGYDITGNTYWWSGSTSGAHGIPGGDASYFDSYSTCLGGGGESGYLGFGPLSGGTFATTDYSLGGIYRVGAGLSGGGYKGGKGGDATYTRGSISPMAGDGYQFGGGGGAGGASGLFNSAGIGATYGGNAGAGTGGGGGGDYGGYNNYYSPASGSSGGGGGGIGIFGIGSDGAAGNGGGGAGGSGGQPGTTNPVGTGSPGGRYGGGGGGAGFLYGTYPDNGYINTGNNGRGTVFFGGNGANGVVRIIWGASRAYPSTNTVDTYSTVTF